MKRPVPPYLIGVAAWGAVLLSAVVINFSDLSFFDLGDGRSDAGDSTMILLAVVTTLLASAAFLFTLGEVCRHIAALRQSDTHGNWIPERAQKRAKGNATTP